MNKRIADYSYKFVENKLFVQDLNLGRISLTNSIESVLEEIEQREGMSLKNLEIIEIDSEGDLCLVVWDGSNVTWKPLSGDLQIKYKQIFK